MWKEKREGKEISSSKFNAKKKFNAHDARNILKLGIFHRLSAIKFLSDFLFKFKRQRLSDTPRNYY